MISKFKNSSQSYRNFQAVPPHRTRTLQNHIASKQITAHSKSRGRGQTIQTHTKAFQRQQQYLDDVFAQTIQFQQFLEHSKQPKSVRYKNYSEIKKCKITQFKYKNKFRCAVQTQNPIVTQCNLSKDKLPKDQLKILDRKKRKLNSLLIQRIAQTLEYYPCLMGHRCKRPIHPFRFSTEQSDQEQSSAFLQMKMINMSKLVLLTEGKLHKNVEAIYDYALSSKGLKNQIKRSQLIAEDNNLSMRKIIKGFLLQKYKTEKLCRQNLVNLCYSLYFHLDRLTQEYSLKDKRAQPCTLNKIRYYQIFQRFLTFKYNYEDLIFYLYSLSIFRHLIKSDCNLIQNQCSVNQNIEDFLIILSGNDKQLIQTYQEYIQTSFPNNQQINLYSLLYFLINDYRKKRQYAKQNAQVNCTSSVQEELSILGQQESVQQINTFFDHSYNYDKQFWSFQEFCTQSIDTELCSLLQNELGYQSKKLIKLLCPYLPIQHRNLINELLLMKAIRMFNCVSEESSHLWQRQMKLNLKQEAAKNSDLIQIERLYRDIKIIALNFSNQNLEQRMIIEFSKSILTSRRLLEKLRELIQYFQSLTSQL